MKEDLNRIESKIDSLKTDVVEIKVLQAEHGVQIKEHIRRTNILEAQVAPIQKHVHYINGAVKFLGILALIAGLTKAIIVLFAH